MNAIKAILFTLLGEIGKGLMEDSENSIFAQNAGEVAVVNGTEANLKCTLNTDLNISDMDNITWIRSPRQILTRGIFRVTDNDRITVAPQVLLRRRDFSLKIRPVLFEDHGEYRCAASTNNRVYYQSTVLRVLVPPKIIRSPVRLLKVDEGAKLHIECSATGNPNPEVTWFFKRNKSQGSTNGDETLVPFREAFPKFYKGWLKFEHYL
ncbi:unnamed protein product [Dicrocoelium dendriticum]|nr:unnamed protein product [Dicrocoelium dendriticum]